jgi:hypothetical protein
LNGGLWGAADFDETLAVTSHVCVFFEPSADFVEDSRGVRVGRLNDAVVHPFAIATRCNHSGSSQVGKMTRNLGLVGVQDFDEEADTNFAIAH